MKIQGLQKMTLLDFPGHVACTVFLAGCDFRCPFCHNYELACGPSLDVMDEEEFMSFLSKRHGLLDGVAVTGGEPCMRRSLPDFLKRIREAGFTIKLDTNGYHPDVLRTIVDGGLADYIAMDIKNSPEKYAVTAGLDSLDLGPINESIGILMDGPADFEFRTTVVAELHSPADMEKIGMWIQGGEKYFLQAFADRDTVPYGGFSAPPKDVMEEYLMTVRKYVPEASLRGVE